MVQGATLRIGRPDPLRASIVVRTTAAPAILPVALVLFLSLLSGVLFLRNGLLMLLRLIRRTVRDWRLLLRMLLPLRLLAT